LVFFPSEARSADISLNQSNLKFNGTKAITDGRSSFTYSSPIKDPILSIDNGKWSDTYNNDFPHTLAKDSDGYLIYVNPKMYALNNSEAGCGDGVGGFGYYAIRLNMNDVKNTSGTTIRGQLGTFKSCYVNIDGEKKILLSVLNGWKWSDIGEIKGFNKSEFDAMLVFSGVITGKLEKVGEFKSGRTINDIYNYSGTKTRQVQLFHNGSEIALRGVEKGDAQNFYNPFTIGGPEFAAMETGVYVLRAYTKDRLEDCSQSGGGTGWCTIVWDGRAKFEILSGGKFKITESTDPNAKIGEIQTLPTTARTEPLINLGITEAIQSPFDDFFENALANMTEWTTKAIVIGGGWVNRVLLYGNDISSPAAESLKNQWTAVRNITLSLLTLAILVIAFANILSIDIERYGLNRMLPKLIIAVVLTYFSYFICTIMLELASALQSLTLQGNTFDAARIGNIEFEAFRSGAEGAAGMAVAETIFLILLLIIVVVAMLYLVLVLIVRVVVVWFLVALAPFAFMMQVLPFTEFLYKQWWSRFAKWVFMGPMIAFLLWLTNSFLAVGFGTSFDTNASPNTYNSWIFLLLAAAGIVMSASIPMMLGGDIINAVKNAAKMVGKGSKYVPGLGKAQRAIKNRWDLRRGARDQREKTSAQMAQYKLANGKLGWVGQKLAGVNATQARQLKETAISQISQEAGLGTMSEKDLTDTMYANKGLESIAAARLLASRGRVTVENETQASKMHQMMTEDGTLAASMFKDNAAAIASLDTYGKAFPTNSAQSAIKQMQSKGANEWKREQVRMVSDRIKNEKTLKGASGQFVISQLGNEQTLNGILRSNDPALKASIGQMLKDNDGLAHEIAKSAGVDVSTLQTFVAAADAHNAMRNAPDPSDPNSKGKNFVSVFQDKDTQEREATTLDLTRRNQGGGQGGTGTGHLGDGYEG